MQRKKMFHQLLVNWIKGSVIIDFSTEHNLTSYFNIFSLFIFEHLEDSCFKPNVCYTIYMYVEMYVMLFILIVSGVDNESPGNKNYQSRGQTEDGTSGK